MTNSPAGLLRLIIGLGVLTLALGACHTNQRPDNASQQPETRTDGTVQTRPETDSKVAEQPSLTGRIGNVSMYPVPNHREDLAVSLIISVTNAGAPTVVQGWSLEVNSRGTRVSGALAPVHVNGVVDMPGSAGKKVDLGKEDLALKTANVPLAKDASVNGILTFVIPKTTETGLTNNSTRLILHFKDAQGNSYQTPAIVVGAKATSGK